MTDHQTLDWVDDLRLRVGDTDFDLFESWVDTDDRLRLLKTREMIEGYLPYVDELRGANMCELGIFRGGSTALFTLLLEPRRLIAFEYEPDRVKALDDFVEARDLADVVRLHFGVDQADQDRLGTILDAELDGEPLDFVIDDASHRYGPTRASFEAIFPRLRPGGLYVIEDWREQQDFFDLFLRCMPDRTTEVSVGYEAALATTVADRGNDNGAMFVDWCARNLMDPKAPGHEVVTTWYAELEADGGSPLREVLRARVEPLLAEVDLGPVVPSLTTLAAELLLAANGQGVVEGVEVNRWWIAVRRGPAAVSSDSFSIADVAVDHMRTLSPRRPPAR